MYKSKVIRAVLFVTSLVFVFGATSVFAQDDDQQKPSKGQLLDAPEIRYERDRVSGVAKSAQPSSIVYEEGFEGDVSGWTGEGVWAIGEPTSGPGGGFESPSAGATNLEGDYPNDSDARLISPSISLPGVSSSGELLLHFREWFEIESGYDEGIVEISTDGGNTWTELSSRSGSSDWRDVQINLTSYEGQEVKLSFRFTSDFSVTFPGWYVDDVQVSLDESAPLSAEVRSINPQNFPYITSNVVVDTFGTGIQSLTQSNFAVFEDGVEQTDNFEVTPPDEGGGTRRVDIVFLMDNSGSMDDEQNAVQNNVIAFVDSLAASGADFALGLTRFGADENGGDPIIEDNGSLTTDPFYFKNEVWSRNVVNGGFEPGWDALHESATNFSFRPGAQRVFILITDESVTGDGNQGTYTKSETEQTLLDQSVTNYALIDSTDQNSRQDYGDLAEATGGAYFDITSPFESILDDIGAEVTDSYVLSYRSTNDQSDGTERTVRVEVTYDGNTAEDTTSYVAGGYPQIVRTQETRLLEDQTWTAGTDFTIQATIEDDVDPPLQEATVFYKNNSDPTSGYESASMSVVNGNLYEATIPGSAVDSSATDYYITATDGEVTSSLPSSNPANKPYQIPILPNEPSEIDHTPITELTPGSPITVEATIIDNTNALESTTLYYRQVGDLTYTTVEMTNTGGDTYEAEIPGSEVTNDGVQYYIEATDNFGVRNTEGTADNPIEVTDLFAGWPDLEDPSITLKVVHPSEIEVDTAQLSAELFEDLPLAERKRATEPKSGLDALSSGVIKSVSKNGETSSFFRFKDEDLENALERSNVDGVYTEIQISNTNDETIGYLPFRYGFEDFVAGRGLDAIVYLHDEPDLQPELNTDRWSDEWDYYDVPDVENPYPLSMLVPPGGDIRSVDVDEKRPVILVHGVSGRYPSWGDDIGKVRDLVGHLADNGYHGWQFYYPENQNITKSGPLLAKAANRLQNNIGYGPNQSFDIVAHSMGGLVSRHYVQRMGIGNNRNDYSTVLGFDPGESGEIVDKFLMLGTPNHGSYASFRCTEGRQTSVCDFLDKDVGAPAFRQMTPGSRFLDELNNIGEPEESYSPLTTLVLSGERNPKELPLAFDAQEIPNQDDAAVAVSSAGLLDIGIPLATGDFVHAAGFDRDCPDPNFDRECDDSDGDYDPRLNEDTKEIITDFLEGSQGPGMVDRFNGGSTAGDGITGYWEGSEGGTNDPDPSNTRNLSVDENEGILTINSEPNETVDNISLESCGPLFQDSCLRLRPLNTGPLGGPDNVLKVPEQRRFFTYAETDDDWTIGFDQISNGLGAGEDSVNVQTRNWTITGIQWSDVDKVSVTPKYLQTTQVNLLLDREEEALVAAKAFVPGTALNGANGSTSSKNSQTEEVQYQVDAATDTLTFWATREGSGDFTGHNMRLVTPDGSVIDSTTAKSESDLGYTQDLDAGSAIYVVEDPVPGRWAVRHDASVSATVSAPVTGTVDLQAFAPDSTFERGETVPVTISTSDQNVYEDADIDAQLQVEDPEGGSPIKLGAIELTQSSPATYEGEFSPSYIGSHQVAVDFSARVDGESVLRRTVESIRVTGDSTETVPDPPPAPSELAADFSESGGVTLDWSGPSSGTVDEYRIYRDTIPDPTRQVTTVSSGQTSYTDSEARKGQTYYYRVTAAGAEGVESDYTDALSIFTYPSSLSVDVQRSFGSLNSEQGYRLVALPGAANQSLGETLGGEAGTEWQAWWDDGSSQDYFQKFDGSDTFRFRAGRGFWALSKSDWSVQQSVETVPLESGQQQTSIPLHDGWNIIANPFGEEVSWNAVNAAHSDSLRVLWRFDGSFAQADTFRSARVGEAFYFLNDSGLDSLKVPYPTGSAVKSQAAGKSQEKKSLVTIRARSKNGDGPASAVKVGFDEEAAEGLDRLDEPAPPGRFSELSLRLQAPGEAPPRRRSLMTERRPPKGGPEKGHTFDLRLQATTGVPIQITASGLEENRSAEAKLLRPSTGRSYDLVEGTPVAIEEADSTGLKLAIGSASYVEEQAKQIVPDEVRLTSYPNPTRGQATIEYTLPEAQEVTLEVYDVLGRRVATLENGRRQAGRHTLRLDGGSLPSGVYFGRLQAGDETRTQKITVVR